MKTINKSMFFIVITIISLAVLEETGSAQSTMVAGADIAVAQTEYGKVRGYIHNGTYVYKGIPYAQAERFLAPEKPDAWEGIRSTLFWGPTCPMMTSPSAGSDQEEFVYQHDWGYPGEDCLRLNIWTPEINDDKKRPVMVWIHGGGYAWGSSQELPAYDGENISKKGDIVLQPLQGRHKIHNTGIN